jgi:hypothetical protein
MCKLRRNCKQFAYAYVKCQLRWVWEADDSCVRGGERGGQLGEGDSVIGGGDSVIGDGDSVIG